MAYSSHSLFEESKKYIPGGVNSPVRAFGSVGMEPIFIREARGSHIIDVDGRKYIDYVLSWGPMILGHAHPKVTEAIERAVRSGTSYGAPTESELDMARMICSAIPSIEMVRMVSSGTEAAMSAIRLARGFTGREKILKFAGCYHGHADSLLVKAGSGVATLGIPGSPGVPEPLAALTITVPYNDTETFEEAVSIHGDDLACIIVEPVAGNMGVVPPKPGFLEALRAVSRGKGILLIFDEVITGFRFNYGGFRNVAKINPDLTCLGKIIGGGLPVGAFGGRKEIMEMLAPKGPIYQAGTLSGNPVAMAAGIATLNVLHDGAEDYNALNQKTSLLCANFKKLFKEKGIPVCINQVGSMFTIFFTTEDVHDFSSAATGDGDLFSRYFRGMLSRGINIAPSPFEASFVSFAHTEDDIHRTLDACKKTISEL
ncbi:MAG: glutamate-1-semialdehyde 2,1-aminomutase [Deltaproteobacteria bacterium]|nr:glutamate-1-semialdehyde 2,1-aminomutase [Deltaproteobacteria bacterium]